MNLNSPRKDNPRNCTDLKARFVWSLTTEKRPLSRLRPFFFFLAPLTQGDQMQWLNTSVKKKKKENSTDAQKVFQTTLGVRKYQQSTVLLQFQNSFPSSFLQSNVMLWFYTAYLYDEYKMYVHTRSTCRSTSPRFWPYPLLISLVLTFALIPIIRTCVPFALFPERNGFRELHVQMNVWASCCHYSANVPCKAISISGVLKSQANLSSWRGRTSVRKGHEVKHMMLRQYQAVVGGV